MSAKEPLMHARCGHPVTLAVLLHDVAIYLYCNTCGDIVEHGDVIVPFSQTDAGEEFNKRNYVVFALEPGDVLKVS